MTGIVRDAWLAEVLGFDVFRVDDPAALESGALSNEPEAEPARALYFAKVSATDVGALELLSKAGFTPVDVSLMFGAPPAVIDDGGTPDPRIRIDVAQEVDEASTLDIAGSCFRYSRFHLDPHVPDAAAHRVKREWVRSYFAKRRGDRLFVAHIDARPAGFLAALRTERDGRSTATIDLVGVSRDHWRQGVGGALVKHFARHYAGTCDALAVGTQAANVPSVRMYERLGFRLTASAYVLHRHTGA